MSENETNDVDNSATEAEDAPESSAGVSKNEDESAEVLESASEEVVDSSLVETEQQDAAQVATKESSDKAALAEEALPDEELATEEPVAEDATQSDEDDPNLDGSADESAEESAEDPADEFSQEQIAEDEPAIPSHFEPIPQDILDRAKRTRRTLIVVIILLILVLAAAVAGSAYYYLEYLNDQELHHVESPVVTLESSGSAVQDRGTSETIEMPNLAHMFGKTPEEVLATLGPNYLIAKTDDISAAPESEEAEDAESSDEEGAISTVGTQVVTISYSPKEQTGTVGVAQVQNIYLTLNASGQTIEVFFVSSLNLLDFHMSSFANLVATNNVFVETLTSAGLTVSPETTYTPPTAEEFTELVDVDAKNKKIKKETTTWKGQLDSEVAPKTFEITFTYDFGATGVVDSPGKQPTQRMLYIKLV